MTRNLLLIIISIILLHSVYSYYYDNQEEESKNKEVDNTSKLWTKIIKYNNNNNYYYINLKINMLNNFNEFKKHFENVELTEENVLIINTSSEEEAIAILNLIYLMFTEKLNIQDIIKNNLIAKSHNDFKNDNRLMLITKEKLINQFNTTIFKKNTFQESLEVNNKQIQNELNIINNTDHKSVSSRAESPIESQIENQIDDRLLSHSENKQDTVNEIGAFNNNYDNYDNSYGGYALL
jgi:hypothetical protein